MNCQNVNEHLEYGIGDVLVRVSLLFDKFWTNVQLIYIWIVQWVHVYIGALVSFTCFSYVFHFHSHRARIFQLYHCMCGGGKHSEQTEKIGYVLVTKLKTLCAAVCMCSACVCMCIDNSFFKHFKSSKNSVFAFTFCGQMKLANNNSIGTFSSFISLSGSVTNFQL